MLAEHILETLRRTFIFRFMRPDDFAWAPIDFPGVEYKDGRLADQTFRRGIGGGLWFAATVVRFNVVIAHGIGAYTRVHFGGTLSF